MTNYLELSARFSLHYYEKENECTADKLIWATETGQLKVLRWLDLNELVEQSTADQLFVIAAENNQLKVLEWLKLMFYFNMKPINKAIQQAINKKHLSVLVWLYSTFVINSFMTREHLSYACRRGEFELVKQILLSCKKENITPRVVGGLIHNISYENHQKGLNFIKFLDSMFSLENYDIAEEVISFIIEVSITCEDFDALKWVCTKFNPSPFAILFSLPCRWKSLKDPEMLKYLKGKTYL
jgi:hypothetical protein